MKKSWRRTAVEAIITKLRKIAKYLPCVGMTTELSVCYLTHSIPSHAWSNSIEQEESTKKSKNFSCSGIDLLDEFLDRFRYQMKSRRWESLSILAFFYGLPSKRMEHLPSGLQAIANSSNRCDEKKNVSCCCSYKLNKIHNTEAKTGICWWWCS